MNYRSLALSFALGSYALAQSGAGPDSRSHIPGDRVTPEQKRALAAFGPGIDIQFGAREVPSMLMGRLAARSNPSDPAADAQDALDRYGASFRRGPYDTFALAGVHTDRDGLWNVRMAQRYKGMPVIGGELTVYLDRDSIVGIAGRFVPDLDVDTGPAGVSRVVRGALVQTGESTTAQVLEARAPVIYVTKDGSGHVAIPVRIADDGSDLGLFIDATSGQALAREMPASTPIAQAGGFPVNQLQNPGFESATASPWTGQRYINTQTTLGWTFKLEPPICKGATVPQARTGLNWACMGGHGFKNTELLSQTGILVPATAMSGTLSFWLQIGTYENPEIYPYIHDTLTIQVKAAGEAAYSTLAVFSNLNQHNYITYQQVSLSIPLAYRGKYIEIRFKSDEDDYTKTWFDIDDTSLTFVTGL